MTTELKSEQVYDIIGLGFGAANLGIAIALLERFNLESPDKLPGVDENPTLPKKTACFVEGYPEFKWHPGMLIPDARMQVNFLKDLVTLRKPTSPFTFVSYLFESDRLVQWINRGSVIPTRKEFSDYLCWAADEAIRRGTQVKYGEWVTSVNRITASVDGKQEAVVEMISRDQKTGQMNTRYGRDLVISPGGAPYILPVMSMISEHENLMHSADFILNINRAIANCCSVSLDGVPMPNRPLRVAVVGSGQSAAECAINACHKLNAIPLPTPEWVEGSNGVAPHQHQVDCVFRKGSLHSFDGSPFANEVFDPENTDAFFDRPNVAARRKNLAEYLPTNYGVANPGTLGTLFELMYNQRTEEGTARRRRHYRLSSGCKVNMRGFSSILNADFTSGSSGGDVVTSRKQPPFAVTIQHTLEEHITTTNYDIIILATGYKRHQWSAILRKSEAFSKCYGLEQDQVELVPFVPRSLNDKQGEGVAAVQTALDQIRLQPPAEDSDSSDSSLNTPLTSPPQSTLGLSELPHATKPGTVGITRGYRLVPKCESDGTMTPPLAEDLREPRVYLQSMTENTHGIGDTLLSVVGIRAQEVIQDIYPH